MPENKGLIGLRPSDAAISKFVAPPYDVISRESALYKILSTRKNLIHIHLRPEDGELRYENARKALEDMITQGVLVEDNEPCYYVYKQEFEGESRIGVMLALEVSDYSEGKVVRHEKTFDDKIIDRKKLREALGYQVGVVFGVVEDKNEKLLKTLNEISALKPLYAFITDFGGTSDMDGILNTVWRIPENSPLGRKLHDLIIRESVYIADGHHRYHCALVMGQEYVQTYISPSTSAKILPYDRVVGGLPEEKLKDFPERLEGKFHVARADEFKVPEKHSFIFYFKKGIFKVSAGDNLLEQVKNDVVKRLDASILQDHILFSELGFSPEKFKDKHYFNYFPGNEHGLKKMVELVDKGEYQFAVSLAPVEFHELKAVADAGIENPEIVMPQKSTYFWPKLLSGIFLYKYNLR